MGILQHNGYKDLYPIHRLDRWTSGLVLLARDAKTASAFNKQLLDKQLHKTYLARVRGEFPEGEIKVDAPILCTNRQKGAHTVNESGKPAQTAFRRLCYNGHTSVVQCEPLTGRTHQIRIHLRHIGYPIFNDLVYGGQLFAENSHSCTRPGYQSSTDLPVNSTDEQKRTTVPSYERADCIDCRKSSYYSGRTHCLSIWLHALQYSGPGWTYGVPAPDWSLSSFETAHLVPIVDTHDTDTVGDIEEEDT